MKEIEALRGGLVAQRMRQRFWNRVCALQALRAPDLIRVHLHAQAHGIPSDEAVVALGFLTEDQVLDVFAGGATVRASA